MLQSMVFQCQQLHVNGITIPQFIYQHPTLNWLYFKKKEGCNNYTPVRISTGLTLFKSIWLSCLPHIWLMESHSDICHKCDNFRKLIMDSVTEEDKFEHTKADNNHVRKAKQEREF